MAGRRYVINGEGITLEESMGVHRFAKEVLKRVDKLLSDHSKEKDHPQLYLLVPKDRIVKEEYRNIRICRMGRAGKKTVTKNIWYHFCFPSGVRKLRGTGVDLTLAIPLSNCGVVAIYDCITEHFPQLCRSPKSRLMRRFYIMRVKKAVSCAETIITTSRFSKDEILKMYQADANKIKVVCCGWEHMENVQSDDSILERSQLKNDKYYFALGSRAYHKNTKWIIEEAKRNPDQTFVITGKSFEDNDVDAIPANVIFTGYLKDEEIKALMQHCRAFLQPSYEEGFGIPPLEAMSFGRKIILSDRSCLPEIYGNSACYIDPDRIDYDLEKVLEMPVEGQQQVLEEYNWDRAANQFYELLCDQET